MTRSGLLWIAAAILLVLALAIAPRLIDPSDLGTEEEAPGSKPVALLEAEGSAQRPALRGAERSRSAKARRPAVVVVGDAAGNPVAGLVVRVPTSVAFADRLTDAKGRALLGHVPLDGSVAIEVRAPVEGAVVLARAVIKRELTYVNCDKGLSVRATFVDAQSGRRMDDVLWGIVENLRDNVDVLFRYQEEQSLRSTRSLPSMDASNILIGVADDELPRHVAWDRARFSGYISRYATSLEFVHPLRREANVQVIAEEADGSVTANAFVAGFKLGDRYGPRPPASERNHDGWRLRGVPFFRDEPIEVLVTRPPREPAEEAEGAKELDVTLAADEDEDGAASLFSPFKDAAVGKQRLPPRLHMQALVRARFPADPTAEVRWGPDTVFFVETDNDLALQPTPGTAPRGAIKVIVRRSNGRPAFAAAVRAAGLTRRTDKNGVALFENLTVGEWLVRVDEPGLQRLGADVHVEAGKVADVELEESPGCDLLVKVVDTDGKRLPFARAWGPARAGWIHLVDGVQRLDSFTDHRGERLLPGFPQGGWTIYASWGGRHGYNSITLRDGRRAEITIKVK